MNSTTSLTQTTPLDAKRSHGRRLQTTSFADVGTAAGVAHSGPAYGNAWGDYDGDGYDDLYVANGNTANKLYRNNGDGTFTDVTTAAGVGDTGNSISSVWGDYDDDGDLDLNVGNYGQANKLYRNNGDGTFTDVTSAAGVGDTGISWALSWGDYDKDGRLDLYVANGGQANKLYRNNRDGTFTDVASAAGVGDTGNSYGSSWVDFDNDGNLDYHVANRGQANKLYRNNGDGTFTNVASAAGVADTGSTFSSVWGDYDDDGDPDLFLANYAQANKLYRNNGDGSFTDVTTAAGVGGSTSGKTWTASWVDFDSDGHLDLSVPNDYASNKLYHNNGDGTFTDVTSAAGVGDTGRAIGSAWGDYDADGAPDLYVANYEQANKLYRNALGVASPTLVVKPLTGNNAPSIFGAVALTTASGALVAVRALDGGTNVQNG